MIDPSIAPKVNANDGASYAAGKNGKAAEPGFSEALSGAGQQDQGPSKESSGETVEETGAGTADTDAQDAAKPVRKPIIDIRAAAAIRGMENAAHQGRNVRQAANGEGEREDEKVESGEASPAEKLKAGKTAKDALEQIAAGEQPAVDETHPKEADEVPVEAGQNGPQNTAIEEVFSLLAAAGDATGATPANTRNNSGKTRSQEPEATRTTTVDASASEPDADIDVDALLAGDRGSDDGAETPDDGGASFRAVRADGKGQPLVLQTAEADARTVSASDDTPTVAVLESRRYIAPVSTSNAANIAAAMSGDRDWVSALHPGSEVNGTHPSAGKVMNTLKIQMSPIELGNVTATLRLSGDALSVHLTVENGAAYRKLNEDNNEIMKTLRAQGYAIDSVQISIASTDRSSSDTSQQNGQQQNGQAPQGDGRQGASSNGNNGERSSFSSRFDNQGTGNEDTSEARTVADDRGNRAGGGVYL